MWFRRSPKKIDIQKGYDLWSSHYATEKNPIKTASDQFVIEASGNLNGRSVIDAGCGTGFFCHFAEETGASEITGIDFSLGMLEEAKKRCRRTQFIQTSIPDFRTEHPVDVIVCALVLGHLANLKLALESFYHNLNENGTLILTDFHPSLSQLGQKRTFKSGKKVFEIPHHIHTSEDYRAMMESVGLKVMETKNLMWETTPVVFAVKAFK